MARPVEPQSRDEKYWSKMILELNRMRASELMVDGVSELSKRTIVSVDTLISVCIEQRTAITQSHNTK